MDEKKVSLKTPPRAFYLGKQEKAIERYARLRELADVLADGSSSKLLQMIADGALEVRKTPDTARSA